LEGNVWRKLYTMILYDILHYQEGIIKILSSIFNACDNSFTLWVSRREGRKEGKKEGREREGGRKRG
jgi:hypothetical protein